MKRFHFRLQRLLEIRQEKEDEQKVILARASGEYQLQVNRKNSILENVSHVREQLKAQEKPNLDQLRAYDKLSQDSDIAIKKLDKVIEEKRKIMEKELEIYTRLKQERRAVEILKEKAWKEYQEKEKREETRELDEIGKNMHRAQEEKLNRES